MERLSKMIFVATLTWNGLDKLKKLKDGLLSNLDNSGFSYEWLIRSNGCKDGTPEEVSKWDSVNLLKMSHNSDNFAKGMNSLADLAISKHGEDVFRKSYILLLNNDIVFRNHTSLLDMIKLMSPEVGQVGARLMFPGTNKIAHYGVIFSRRYGKMPWHYMDGQVINEQSKKDRYFQATTAAVTLLNGNDFLNVGKLDQSYWWAFEDIDLSLKLKSTGKKIIVCGSTEIDHEQSATLKKNNVNKLFMSNNVNLFKQKWFGKYEIDHDKYLRDPNYNVIK